MMDQYINTRRGFILLYLLNNTSDKKCTDVHVVEASLTATILGGSVVLKCSVSCNCARKTWSRQSAETILIVHNGKIFNPDALNVRKFSIDYNNSDYNLVITNISKQEEGVYCCAQVLENDKSVQICTNISIVDQDRNWFSRRLILYTAVAFSCLLVIVVATTFFVQFCIDNRHKIGTDVISAETDPMNSTSSSARIQEISNIEYEEVEIEHPGETDNNQLGHSTNATDSSISDRSHLDFELNSYEEMIRSGIEHHEYLEYVHTTD